MLFSAAAALSKRSIVVSSSLQREGFMGLLTVRENRCVQEERRPTILPVLLPPIFS